MKEARAFQVERRKEIIKVRCAAFETGFNASDHRADQTREINNLLTYL